MSSLKSTPRQIVTNFFFGLNAACKPPRRPHSNTLHAPCNSPHASLPFPSRPEGAEAPSPGHRPGYSCPHAWRPERAKALKYHPEYDIQAEKNRRKDDVNGFFFVLLHTIKEMQGLWNLDS